MVDGMAGVMSISQSLERFFDFLFSYKLAEIHRICGLDSADVLAGNAFCENQDYYLMRRVEEQKLKSRGIFAAKFKEAKIGNLKSSLFWRYFMETLFCFFNKKP